MPANAAKKPFEVEFKFDLPTIQRKNAEMRRALLRPVLRHCISYDSDGLYYLSHSLGVRRLCERKRTPTIQVNYGY